MSFSDIIETCETRFRNRGECVLRAGESLAEVVAAAGVPEAPGVYLVYGRRGERDDLLYVDKAGTIRNDGTFGDQGLAGRLVMKQYGKLRTTLWPRWIDEKGLDALVIRWFVTVGDGVNVLPVKAEADLLQAWYEDGGRLPPENREA
jgi:hypothetical protein